MKRVQGGLLLAAVAALSACDARDPMGATGTEPASIVLSSQSPAVLTSFGDSAIVLSEVRDRSGNPLSGVALQWTTVPAGILQIDGQGILRAVGNGRVTVVAEIAVAQTGVRPSGYWAGGLADSLVIEVQQKPARLEILPVDTAFSTLGARRQLRVRVTDARGHLLQQNPPPLSWLSDDPRVVTVDTAGVVRSSGEGEARVRVSAGELIGESGFSVRPRLPHTSCMVFEQRRQSQQSCVTLELIVREREASQ